MAVETITVNGVDLSTLVRNVESLAGLLRTPERRGENIAIAGRSGRLRQSGRSFEAGVMTLPLWVVGADAASGATLYGDAAVTSFYARADELVRLLHAEPLTIDHTLPDGSVRRAVAELADEPLDFTRQLGSPLFGRVSVALTIPGAFWSDVSTVSVGPTALATGASTTLTAFAGATAPMEDLIVTFGPGSNPSLSQPLSGAFVAYDGVIASGRKLVVDTETWSVTGTIDAGGTWAPLITAVRFGPAAKFFYLTPPSAGTGPVVSLAHTGGGTATVTVSGRRKYMTG